MDEFGVLVERYGVKVQGGKSTPMANLKSKTTNSNNGFPSNAGSGHNSAYTSDPFGGNDLDGFFRSQSSKNYDNNNDIFGGVFANSNNVDIEAVLGGSVNKNSNSYGSCKINSYDDFDLFGTAMPKKSEPIDDLFGNLGLNTDGPKKGPAGTDDLIPGFGDFSSPSFGKKLNPKSSQQSNSSKSSSPSADDPFLVFESSASEANASSWPFSESSEHHPGSSSVTSTIDELEDFANFKVRSNTTEGLHDIKRDASVKNPVDRAQEKSKNIRVTINKPNKTTKPKPAAEGHVSAVNRQKAGRPEEKKSVSSKKTVSPVKNFVDDLMFFGDFAPTSEAFQEVEGESEERRTARLKNHMKTQERMAKALAEKTQRDLQSQNEQEEKHRLAEMLEYDIKRWATGKEGNLRALLSSLQHVLWPECGWQPVSLTDLITSTSVKKVYHRATLCVHPDKVQQKGATVRQKYIAEKVFDLLKEAWNKFNSEELR